VWKTNPIFHISKKKNASKNTGCTEVDISVSSADCWIIYNILKISFQVQRREEATGCFEDFRRYMKER
jgi:hypothetical protein